MNKFFAYLDLTRAHFAPAWPLIFCAGLMTGFATYGGFSWIILFKAILIAFFGFEAGFVLNDYVDRDYDKKDVEKNRLTRYFRPFGSRPLSSGLISPKSALFLFFILFLITSAIIFTLPFPNNFYVFVLMFYSYVLEVFYQIKKRKQKFPWSQILGRTDFGLFMTAGYLCVGKPDLTALMLFLFFYPLALVHLAVNDLIDIKNDIARGMNSVPILLGIKGSKLWVTGFTVIHIIFALLFLQGRGSVLLFGFILGFLILFLVNLMTWRKNENFSLWSLFFIHLTFVVYSVSMILGAIYLK